MKSIIGQVIYLVLFFFLLLLLIRFVMTLVMQFGHRWRAGRFGAASLELVWTVTDPPLHALRRMIPPLRIGTVGVDIAFMVLIVILSLLMYVAHQLF